MRLANWSSTFFIIVSDYAILYGSKKVKRHYFSMLVIEY